VTGTIYGQSVIAAGSVLDLGLFGRPEPQRFTLATKPLSAA